MKGVTIRIKSNLLKSRFEEIYFICHSMSINFGENPRQNQFNIDGIAITNTNIINLKIISQLNPHFGGHLMFHRFWESEIALNERSPVNLIIGHDGIHFQILFSH